MIACFQLKIRLAIDVLLRGAERNTLPQCDRSNLSMAALALSGLSFEKSAMWRSQCSIAHSQITDSHLRAIFAFLTPDNDHSYDTVLVSFSFIAYANICKHLYGFDAARDGCFGQ